MNELEKILEIKDTHLQMGGSEGIAKQHSLGKLNARERITRLADSGSFQEFGLLADHTPSNLSLKDKLTPADGVITGVIQINSRPVGLVAYDFTVVAGTIGEVGERKVQRIRHLCRDQKIPLVWLLDSAGARIQEIAGAQFAGTGSLFLDQVQLSGVVPMVAAVMGPTAAGTSYIAALADYTPMVKGTSSMALAGPPLVKAAISEDITTEELGGSKIHCQISGCGDGEFANDEECLEAIKAYLSFFPQNSGERPPKIDSVSVTRIDDSILEIIPKNPKEGYEVKEVLKLLSDDQKIFEIKPDYAKNIVTCFVRIAGYSVGIVANQPSFMGGAIDINAADKATRFLLTCEAFNIPVLFAHDTPGFLVGSQVEKAGIIRHGAKLLHVVGNLQVPKFSLVLRKSYGAGYYVMCGRGLEPDLLVGWPTAEISLMGAQGAVNIVMKNNSDENEKAEKLKDYQSQIGGLKSAQLGFLDDLIDPRDTRIVLRNALQWTATKPRKLLQKHTGIWPV